MGIFSWIVFGLLAGAIAGSVTGRRAEGCLAKIAVGVAGALIGGGLARAAGIGVSFQRFTLKGVLVASLGAALLLFVLTAIQGGNGRIHRR